MAITAETQLIAADARQRLQSMSDAQVTALTRAWVEAWDELAPEFSEVLVAILAGSTNQRVTRAALARNKQLSAALQRARVTLDELAGQVQVFVANDLGEAVLDAAQTMTRVGASQLPATAPQLGVVFDMPAGPALDAIVTRTTEVIVSRTSPLPADVDRAMRSELIRGIAVGDNPLVTARRMVRRTEERFNGGLARAAKIARTEKLDAYRSADQTAARHNNDLLTGWLWSATLDARTCPSCIVQHGSLHLVDEFGPLDHQQGRCARIDKTKTWRELGFDIDEPADDLIDARAWFDGLTPDTQQKIIGTQRLELLQSGQAGWDDLSTRKQTDGWRDNMHVTPVRDLLRSVG